MISLPQVNSSTGGRGRGEGRRDGSYGHFPYQLAHWCTRPRAQEQHHAGERGDPHGPSRVIGDEQGRPIYLFSTDSPSRIMTGDFEAMALYAGAGVDRIDRIMPADQRVAQIVDQAVSLLGKDRRGH